MNPCTHIYSADEGWICTRQAFAAANTIMEADQPGICNAVLEQLDTKGWCALDAGNCGITILVSCGPARPQPLDGQMFIPSKHTTASQVTAPKER
jgi:hypothetical protein